MRSTQKGMRVRDVPRKSTEPLWMPVALVALVIFGFLFAGLVWWQLLSELP